MKTTLLGSALSGLNIPPVGGNVPAQPTINQVTSELTQQVANGLAIPAAFGQIATIPSVEDLPEPARVYAFFPHPLGKNYGKCVAAGAKEGDAVVSVEGNIVVLRPLKFFLAMGFGCRVKTANDNSGKILAMHPDIKNYPDDISEEYYATLAVVFANGQLIPCSFDFKTTKASAASDTFRALHQCVTAEWVKMSPAHAATASFPIPWGRVVWEGGTTRHTSGKGMVYYATDKKAARPAKAEEMRMLQEAAGSEQFLAAFTEAQNTYNRKVNELRAKVRG